MRHTGIVLFLVASAAIQAAETRVAQPEVQTRKTKPGFAKTVAAGKAPSKSSPPSAARGCPARSACGCCQANIG